MEVSTIIYQDSFQLWNSVYSQWLAVLGLIGVIVVSFVFWRNYAHKRHIKQRYHLNKGSNNNLAQPAMKPCPVENRDIKSSKNTIPLENIVVSEIPISKAVSIGHLEPIKDDNNKK